MWGEREAGDFVFISPIDPLFVFGPVRGAGLSVCLSVRLSVCPPHDNNYIPVLLLRLK